MTRHRTVRSWLAPALLAVAALCAAGCSSADDSAGDQVERTTTTTTPFDGQAPDQITAPAAEGAGINRPQPAGALPDGYVEQEYFLAGTATSFAAVDTPDDGAWTVTPDDRSDYRTRVIVRRPAEAEDFSGTVLVEWFNVSALEAAPDWAYLSGAITRDGHAYVGVSAQAQGVEGGDTLLDVEVDPDAAGAAGTAADSSGLKNIDPERYGTLAHPGDAYSFDIFSQVGRAVAERSSELLGDLAVERVLAMGESQSAMFMTTLVNAVHPLDPVFDGFLVHSRGSVVPEVDGTYVRSRQGETDAAVLERGVTIRDDLDVPVMIVIAETDLTLLGYAYARQPDTELIRTWEIAGTAHADSETLRAVIGGPRDPSVGQFLGCGPVNSGPHKEVLRAAVDHLIRWAADGAAPPEGDRLQVDMDGGDMDGGDMEGGSGPAIVRDGNGNALGGIRTPLVDVPVATLTGDPPGGASLSDVTDGGGVCALFGQTIPFDRATLVELYGDADTYLERFAASLDRAVDDGFVLRPDADALLADVEPNRALFP